MLPFLLPKGKGGNSKLVKKGILLSVCFSVWQRGLENILFMKSTFSQRGVSARRIKYSGVDFSHTSFCVQRLLHSSSPFSLLSICGFEQISLIPSVLKLSVAKHKSPTQAGDIPRLTSLFMISAMILWQRICDVWGKKEFPTSHLHPTTCQNSPKKATGAIIFKLVVTGKVYSEMTETTLFL